VKLNVRVAGDRLRMAGVGLTAFFLVLIAGILLYAGGHGSKITTASADNRNSPWPAGRPFDSAQGGLRGRRDLGKSGSQIAFASVPLGFEANQGQTDDQVKFLARGGGYTLFLTQEEAVLKLQSSAKHSAVSTQDSEGTTSVVRMKLIGASSRAGILGTDQLASRSNYFIGNDASKWRRSVPQFAQVRYQQVYPGIDLVYYGNQGRLEYDFQVAPGADPTQIGLQIGGARKVHVNAQGGLVAETAAGDVQLQAPEIYQRVGNQKRLVAGTFALQANNRVRFALGEYDRTRELIIDPVLKYSTYLGGTGDEGCAFLTGTYTTAVSGCPAIAVDASGNMYVAGATTSPSFPTTGSPFQGNNAGGSDAFIAKFNVSSASVYTLGYWTFLGGTGNETTAGVAVDINLNVYVAGNTSSAGTNDFPTTSNGNQTTPPASGTHGFLSVLNSTGSALSYSTYVEGNGTDTITGLAVDTRTNAYVTGTTTSDPPNFPITAGAIQTVRQSANPQIFLSKFNTQPTGGSVQYSTYFGSTLPSSGAIVQGGGVAVDQSGLAYITGGTNFLSSGSGGNFPILNAYQSCLDAPGATSCPSPASSHTDAFVAKIDTAAASGAQLKYSSYIGGGLDEIGYGVAVDINGNAYVTGSTDSTNFPIASATSAFQASNAGGFDAFVAKFGTTTPIPLSYSSYLGDTGTDVAYAIAVDVNQAAHVTGVTDSPNSGLNKGFNVNAIQGSPSTVPDAFVALIPTTSTGQTGGFATYLGGNGSDDGTGITVDSNSNTYVAGETGSSDFPLASAQFGSRSGNSDVFVSKIVPSPSGVQMSASGSITSGAAGIGNQVTFSYAIKNTGPDVATNVIFTTVLPATGATSAAATSTPGSCTAVVNGTISCFIGSLGVVSSTAAAQATVKVNLTPTAPGTLTSSGSLQADGTPVTASSASVTVADFSVAVSPSTAAVVAGNTATYQVQVGDAAGQTNFFPDGVSLSCSAGVPTGAACTFSTNPVTLTSTSPISSTLTLTTTARPVTTGRLQQFRNWYAAMLPIGGLTFLGFGIGTTRRRRWLIAIFAVLVLGMAGFQLACSSGSGATTPPPGTPAGTYPITLTGTSGSASHAVRMNLVVQ
jgi:uncharacterized repeat protein (TIGR01451 family)